MKWTSIEDKLPKIGEKVWTFEKLSSQVGLYESGVLKAVTKTETEDGEYRSLEWSGGCIDPGYWMPIILCEENDGKANKLQENC